MKITPNTPLIGYGGKQHVNKGQASLVKTNTKNFDEILISKNEAMPEGMFISELKNRILKEVQAPAPEKNIEEIRCQIEDGSYETGIDEVIRRMMLS